MAIVFVTGECACRGRRVQQRASVPGSSSDSQGKRRHGERVTVRLAPPISALPNGDSGSQRKDIWIGQRFLMNEFGAIQPAIAAARLAAEAGTMRVGLTIYLLPLLNPVAIAEEAADRS